MKKIILLIVISFISIIISAQHVYIEWQKCIGGSNTDIASFVKQTNDGGYISGGYTNSIDGDIIENKGGYEFWVFKLDSLGNIEWNKTYGGSYNDQAYCLDITYDQGYIVAGDTYSDDHDVHGFHGVDNDLWVVRMDSNGDTLWTNCYGGSGREVAISIIETSDSNYVVVGYTDSFDGDVNGNNGGRDAWILKIGQNGDILWSKTYGGSYWELFSSIHELENKELIVCGASRSSNGDIHGNHGNYDGWILRLDQNGDTLWSTMYGGYYDDKSSSLTPLSDGSFVLASYSKSFEGDISDNNGLYDVCVAKFDSLGNLVWSHNYGGLDDEFSMDIIKNHSGNYIVVGSTESNEIDVIGQHGEADIWLLEIDSNGDTLWTKCLGGSLHDFLYSIQQTEDHGYILSGETRSNDFDVSGNHNMGERDAWIVKILPGNSNIETINKDTDVFAYPNPVYDYLYFNREYKREYLIINTHGKVVLSGTTEKQVDMRELPNGLYIVRFLNNEQLNFESKKILKL